MLKAVKSLTKFLVPIALINSSVYARTSFTDYKRTSFTDYKNTSTQTGFFIGGSVNIQQNNYQLNKIDGTKPSNLNNTDVTLDKIKQNINDLYANINAESIKLEEARKNIETLKSEAKTDQKYYVNDFLIARSKTPDDELFTAFSNSKNELTTNEVIKNTFAIQAKVNEEATETSIKTLNPQNPKLIEAIDAVVEHLNKDIIDENKKLLTFSKWSEVKDPNEKYIDYQKQIKDKTKTDFILTNHQNQLVFRSINEKNIEQYEIFFRKLVENGSIELNNGNFNYLKIASGSNFPAKDAEVNSAIKIVNVQSKLLLEKSNLYREEQNLDKIDAKEKEIAILEQNIKNAKEEIFNQVEILLQDKINDINSLEKQITNLEEKLQKGTLELAENKSKVDDLGGKLTAEQANVNAIGEKLKDEQAKVTIKEQELAKLQAEKDALANKLTAKERELAEALAKLGNGQVIDPAILLEEQKAKLLEEARKEQERLKQEELASIKSSASRIEPSISLLAGYGVKVNDFGFITEAGVDLSLSKVGNNSNKELEVKNMYNIYLTQKVGYYFTPKNLTYITGGLSIKDTKISYKGEHVNINESSITPNLILGIGYQRTLTRNWAMFTEFNHIVSLAKVKTEAGDVKTRSEQVRVGVRYYF